MYRLPVLPFNQRSLFQKIDFYMYSARVEQNWGELSKALELSYKLDILGNSNDTSIIVLGWTTNFKKINRKVKEYSKPFVIKSMSISRKFRPDVYKEKSLLSGFSGFEIRFVFRDGINQRNSNVLQEVQKFLDALKLDFTSSRKYGIFPTELHIDSIIKEFIYLKKNDFSWFGYLIHSPFQAIYLMEISNAKDIAKEIQKKLQDLNLISLFHNPVTQNFVLNKLALISNTFSISNDFDVNQIEYINLEKVSNFENKSQKIQGRKITRKIIEFVKTDQNFEILTSFNTLDNVKIRSDGRVLRSRCLIQYDKSDDPKLDFVAGRWTHEIGSVSNFNNVVIKKYEQTQNYRAAIHLISRADENWFHWLIENLPRLLLVPKNLPDNVPILVSDRLSSRSLETLSLLTNRSLIKVASGTQIEIDTLYLPGPVIYHPDSSEIDWEKRSIVNVDLILQLRNLVFDKLNVQPKMEQNYFLVRNSQHRRLLNQTKISKILESKFNFKTIDPSTLDFIEQVKLFSTAKLIVFAGGAAMANLIFVPNNSKVIVLTSKELHDFIMPAILGSIANAQVFSILGKSSLQKNDYKSAQDKFHADFKIDMRSILRLLRRINKY